MKKFYQSQPNGETDFLFAQRGDRTRHSSHVLTKNFLKSVIVWGGISKSGKINFRIIKSEVKVNARYCIEEIAKPF